MRIRNLTNSPYDILAADSKPVRLPARGTIEVEPHPQRLPLYRALGYFRIEDEVAPSVEPPAPAQSEAGPDQDDGQADQGTDVAIDPAAVLREEYQTLSGKSADKRWSSVRLAAEIEKLKV